MRSWPSLRTKMKTHCKFRCNIKAKMGKYYDITQKDSMVVNSHEHVQKYPESFWLLCIK
jgi:hypothetical protein